MKINHTKIQSMLLNVFTQHFNSILRWYKRSDIKDNPVNVNERVRKNIEEGRG